MRLRLLALATLFAATSAHAQQTTRPSGKRSPGTDIVMTVSVKGSPQRAYRASMDALRSLGYEFRALLLDEMIITLPRTMAEAKEFGADAVAVQLKLEPHGADSTRITLGGFALRRDDNPCAGEACTRLDAASLLVSGQAMDRLTKTLDAMPPLLPSRGDTLAAAGAYGYSRENPVRVGGGLDNGAANEHRFLATLRGPGGEAVSYVRLGSCCEHDSPHGIQGRGVLDAYEVTYPGLPRPVILYIDMYEVEPLKPVDGFTQTAAAQRSETTR